MKVILLDSQYSFSCVPRITPLLSDTIVLTLRNELTDEIITPEINFTVGQKLNVNILDNFEFFKEKNKYEISIKLGSVILYKGKLIALDQNTNIQDYEYGSQTTKRFDYK
jgi:uncharacterized membrane protein